MAVITSAKYTTPDGVERPLRYSQASQFRVSLEQAARGGSPPFVILWAMMFDEDDNPPMFTGDHPRAGQAMTANWLGANLAPSDNPRLLAAISEATTGAKLEKKIVEEMEKRATEETRKLHGLISGLTLESISDSPEVPPAPGASLGTSGGSLQGNSPPSTSDLPKASEAPISEAA